MWLPGCDMVAEEEEEVEDLTIVVEADKSRILEEEEALDSKREEVQNERDRLAREREDVERRLASLSKKDRKTREKLEGERKRLDKEEKRVRDRARKFEAERTKLAREKTELLQRIATLTKRGQGGLTIEQREAQVGRRESNVARREEALAKREAAIAGRETQASQTLQDLNGLLASLKGGGMSKTVYVSSPAASAGPTAANATKAQAQKAQRAARSRMDTKGILMDDLPPTAKTLFKQGGQSIGDKDYGEAVAAFGQVSTIVDGIAIDHTFVQAKMGRLNRAMANKELGDKDNQKVQGLLSELSNAFADGRFDRANKKANQIATVLKKN